MYIFEARGQRNFLESLNLPEVIYRVIKDGKNPVSSIYNKLLRNSTFFEPCKIYQKRIIFKIS